MPNFMYFLSFIFKHLKENVLLSMIPWFRYHSMSVVVFYLPSCIFNSGHCCLNLSLLQMANCALLVKKWLFSKCRSAIHLCQNLICGRNELFKNHPNHRQSFRGVPAFKQISTGLQVIRTVRYIYFKKY